MSWYNNQNQGFIDATQELQSGGGASQTIINEVVGEISDVFIPKQLNTENASYDTIIVNNTANSRIFFQNQNTTNKVKIEGGKLYLYYEYDLTNASTITTGWIDVDNYITANRQSLIELGADLIALNAYVATPATANPTPLTLQGKLAMIDLSIDTITFEVEAIGGDVIDINTKISQIEYDIYGNRQVDSEMVEDAMNVDMEAPRADQALSVREWSDLLDNASVSSAGIQQGGISLPYQSSVSRVIENVYLGATLTWSAYLQYVLVGLGGAGVLLTLFYIATDNTKEINLAKLETKTLLAFEKLSKISTANDPKNIHINGLLIIENTNTDLFYVGNYTINLSNNGQLIIEVKLVNSVPKAFIKEVKKIGNPTFNVNDIINIPKSQIGSNAVSNLQIQITSLISEKQILQNILIDIQAQRGQVYNRRRLRDGIINTSELGDGLTTQYNSTITNVDTGEVLQVPTIKLNLNSTQLETISGVLNIKKYINSDDLAKIHEILLPSGATITSDYKLNLGYKEIFSGYPYDLIMMAIKSDTYTTFSATNYNNDYLGYFPNMSRLALGGDAKVINTTTLTANSSQHFTKGLIYIKNTNELKVFNLNRKFEFVSFLKFSSFINSTASYHIIQNGVDLGGQIELDNTKLSVYIKNRKLRIKQPALVSYGVYTTGSLNSITTRLLGAIEYFILEPITISGVPYNDNIRITSTPMGAGYDDYKYELKMLNVPYRLNNESEFINTPTGFIRVVNANDTTQPAFDTRFIAMYLGHPSVPSTTIANCIYPTISYKVGIKNNGDVFLDPDWNIQRIVLRFDILFHRTQDINIEGGGETGEYFDFPVLYHENTQSTDYKTDFTFRLRYSVDGVNYITHNFTMNNITGSGWENNPTSTGTTIRTGWYNNMSLPKRYWTYTYTIPNTYPIYGQKVRFVDFTLVKKPNWVYLPDATTAQNPYMYQPVLHLYEFKLEEYTTTPTQQVQVIANNYETIDNNPAFVAGISNSAWYLFNLQLDLPNNSINYYLNNTLYNFTERNTIDLYPADTTMPDPAVPFVSATFVSWANLTQDNSLLVIGNSPSIGEVHFTHFNWRYFQTTEQFLTLTQVQKLTGLIAYNYYYDYVSVDKLLDTNEISANRILTKQLVVNNNSLINGFTSATRSRDLRSDQTQEAGNVLIKITNLYVENPPAYNGNLYYNYLTKTFTVRSVSGRSDEDDNIRAIIQASAGTGLEWNGTTNKLNVMPESFYQDLTPIYTLIGTNDQNVSNYVWETSNYLKGVIDNIPPPTPYDDTAIYTQITTTSNILLTDFVARDAVLKVDYIARDDIITADSIERDDNLSASIEVNKYTDAKVASYLGNFDTKIINGFVGIGTTNPLSQLEIKGQYATLRIVDSDTGTLNPKIDLIRGTGLFGSDATADWRIENLTGLFQISRQLTSGNPDFLNCISIFGNGNIGFGIDIPQARFHGHASTISTRVATKYTDGTTTAGLGRGFDIGKDGNQNAFLENWENTAMRFTTNATERMRILNNGDVGIGTNAVPFAKLHLHKSGASQDVRIQFTDDTTGTTANDGTIVGKLPDGRGFLYNYENAELFFGTAGVQRMMITATGNVGIGTATTTSKLRVEGSCTINGFMTAYGTLSGGFLSVTNAGMDMLGIPVTTTTGSTYYSSIRVVFGTFTGFHRCYTSDILYNEDESDIFKNKYAGRLVVATGKIKTDISDENNEWKSLYDKEAITYEDAVPIVELSRRKKDKRIFGVLGLPTRISNNKNRLIVNSVGEGAICVANTNGNIENGDYLQSSDLLGYGERQDDDILHNYTVAKATMDCDFQLNSPYYQSYEENGVIYALIACSYHSG